MRVQKCMAEIGVKLALERYYDEVRKNVEYWAKMYNETSEIMCFRLECEERTMLKVIDDLLVEQYSRSRIGRMIRSD